MTELTDRLRFEQAEGYTICGEAADEIEHLMLDLHTERAAVVALRSELDALREDAARYRWLRDWAKSSDWEFIGLQTDTNKAVDAARATWKAAP